MNNSIKSQIQRGYDQARKEAMMTPAEFSKYIDEVKAFNKQYDLEHKKS